MNRRNILRILRFKEGSLPNKYLGAPLFKSQVKQVSWREVLDKMRTKLDNWTYRALNLPGRLTLVKAVLQALRIYLFSVMAAPKKIPTKMRRLQRNFLWGGRDEKIKWALVKWDTVCTPKLNGGLGLRDPETNNDIMGAKTPCQNARTFMHIR